ncbi:hypothetical protein X741_26745 [Mesorhizobium sp. LNHC229A00]|nr:hypothetical protein X741_26745 [Mesorhizobium sp. LNHC229A00]
MSWLKQTALSKFTSMFALTRESSIDMSTTPGSFS